MDDLLKLAIEAHGGLERWRQFNFIRANASITGALWQRYEGREEVEGSFKFVRDLYPDMDFHDVRVVCETPDVVVGEYEFTTKSSKTGRVIHQLFVGRLEAENGRVKLLRESINLVELGLAIYTNGLADYKAPQENETNSIPVI
jgi:hypothetical protein